MRATKKSDKWRKVGRRWANGLRVYRTYVHNFWESDKVRSLVTILLALVVGSILGYVLSRTKNGASRDRDDQKDDTIPTTGHYHALYVEGDDDRTYMEYNFDIKEILDDADVGLYDKSVNNGSSDGLGDDGSSAHPNLRDFGPSINDSTVQDPRYSGVGVDRVFDLANRYVNFDNDYWYGNTEESPKWPLSHAQKRQIVMAINESLYHLTKKFSSIMEDEFIVTEAYWRPRIGLGTQYILDFRLQIVNKGVSWTSNKTVLEMNKRVIFNKRYGNIGSKARDTVTIKDLDEREDHITVIIPLSDIGALLTYAANGSLATGGTEEPDTVVTNEGRKLDELVGRLAQLCDPGISLMVSYCGRLEYDEPIDSKDKLRKGSKAYRDSQSHSGSRRRASKVTKLKVTKDEVSDAIANILRRHTDSCQGFEIQLVSVDSNGFVKAKALSGGISAVKDEDLIFVTNLDAHWGASFLRRCRHNAVYGKMVYVPVPYKLYNPYIVDQYSSQGNESENGHWLDGDYGTMCMYKDDYVSVRGYNSTLKDWGADDKDLYTKFMLSDIKVFRSTDNDLIYDYADPLCLKEKSSKVSEMGFMKCMEGIRQSFGSKSQLARRIFSEMFTKSLLSSTSDIE